LGLLPDTDIYERTDICQKAKEINGLKIVRYEDSIYFANAELFLHRVLESIGLKDDEKKSDTASLASNIALTQLNNKIGLTDVILDMSCVNFIDLMGLNQFKEVFLFKKFFSLTNVDHSVYFS
jgi:hypothetical protein